MKVLGLCCGRKMGNTEILVKEALMGAEEMGAEVELVRLMDLNLKPCTGCNDCVVDIFEKGGNGACIIKDDLQFIEEKILECDGLIVGSPIYEKSPTGYLKILSDRMGASHDMSLKFSAKNQREKNGLTSDIYSDKRALKPRVASLFAVGGKNLSEFALPMMQLFVMPMHITVVDQYLFNLKSIPSGGVAMIEEPLQRARMSGRHVAETLKKPIDEATFIGEEGTCPVCHSKLLEMTNSISQAKCAVCGVKGALKISGEQLTFEVNEEEKAKSKMLLEGEFVLAESTDKSSLPDMKGMPERLERYKSYLTYSKPLGYIMNHKNGYTY